MTSGDIDASKPTQTRSSSARRLAGWPARRWGGGNSLGAQLPNDRNLLGQADHGGRDDDPAGDPVAAGEDDDPEHERGQKPHRQEHRSTHATVECCLVGHGCLLLRRGPDRHMRATPPPSGDFRVRDPWFPASICGLRPMRELPVGASVHACPRLIPSSPRRWRATCGARCSTAVARRNRSAAPPGWRTVPTLRSSPIWRPTAPHILVDRPGLGAPATRRGVVVGSGERHP